MRPVKIIAAAGAALSAVLTPAASEPALSEEAENYHTALVQAGFVVLSLETTQVGHFYLEGSLSGRAVTFLVDTGAASTVIDLARARAFGFDLEAEDFQGGGAGGTLDVYSFPDAEIRIGDFSLVLEKAYAMDLSHVAAALSALDVPAPDVVLGADFLKRTEAKIDYAGPTLYLKQDAS